MTETTSRGIMIYWQFIHTGGLNITSINITYTINDEATIQRGPEVNENDTTAFIPAVDEDSYNIMVTATNTEGSASAECPLVTFSKSRHDFSPSEVVLYLVFGNIGGYSFLYTEVVIHFSGVILSFPGSASTLKYTHRPTISS